jgi:D-xylose transport system ATP-binding protein
VRIKGPQDATELGIATVYQDLALCDNLDVVANLFLGQEEEVGGPVRALDEIEMEQRSHELLEQLSVTIPSVRSEVGTLSGGQRQQVAVMRAVMWGSHIVLLDEPAAALGVRQTELVLSLVERLKGHGVAIVFISHNMQHVLRVADRVAVLFLGEKVADFELTEETKAADLVGLITGATAGDRRAAEALG